MSQLSLLVTKLEAGKSEENLDYEEYGDNSRQHLIDADAYRKYLEEKSAQPNALITLDHLDCGHWVINTYSTESQKQRFLQSKWTDLIKNFSSMFRK